MTPTPESRRPAGPRLAAVVLSGGTAARMGGVAKADLEVDGLTLLHRSLAAAAAAEEVVVVGARVPTPRPVSWTVEDPPLGGPAAGLLAGLDSLVEDPDLVLVLAVDMPRVTEGTVQRLRSAVLADPTNDGALLVDGAGRRQPLAAVYRYPALLAARPRDRADEHGLPVRRLVGGLRLVAVPASADEARDVDTWKDWHDLRQ